MKRFTTFLILQALALIAVSKPVDMATAQKFAYEFISLNGGKAISPENVKVLNAGKVPLTYVVNFIPQGWVLLSADDRVQSVLAYSTYGHFNVEEVKSVPFYFWFQGYADEISHAISSKTDKMHPSWSINYYQKSKGESVEPLIQVNWNQSAGWNEYCPADPNGPGGHAYAGCVAVAMAQCMSVFKYPTRGYGEHSYTDPTYGNQYVNYSQQEYNWDLMPATTANEHVAKLLYHLGVSVNMNYGADGSGAYSQNVPYAIKTYFDYTSRAKIVSKSSYTDEDWRALLTSELLAGRPIYYSGDGNDGQAGHAFCLDGVNQNGLFHFNWGWSGSYNGYYSIGSLTPGSYNFSYDQQAVIYFEPRNHSPYDIQISNNTVYENKPAGEFVGKLVASDETPNDSHTFEVHGAPGIDGEIGDVPFTVNTDSLVTTNVLNSSQAPLWEIVVKATDLSGLSFEKSMLIQVLKQSSTDDIPLNVKSVLSAFVKDGSLVVEFNHDEPGIGIINLVSIDGVIIKSFNFQKNTGSHRILLNISDIQNGIYIVQVVFQGKNYALKLFIP
jgi:hypothetical protein